MRTLEAATLLLLIAMLGLAHTQILAIDYGTKFIKASLVHVGAGKSFSIVENHKSQRKFINSVGLYNQERFYQAETFAKRSRTPTNCFIYSHLLIDAHNNPSLMSTVKKDLLLEYINQEENDQMMAQFVLKGFPEGEDRVSLMETMGMMLKYVKLAAEKAAKGSIKDVILIVPNHWTIHQRKFLTSAAELAQLYVLSLIHENTAAAINYALSQRNTNKTETILFYNLGANSLQMTLAEFRQVKTEKNPKPVESIFILGDYGRPYLGGLKVDSLIAEYFANKFEEKYKKPLNTRGRIKLLAESEKIKLVLSANKEATIFVEGIMDGIDFSAHITRSQMERMAQPFFKQAVDPVSRFLFDHDLRSDDLTAVELIGGGSRVPKIQSMLSDVVDNSSLVGSHINGDEAMVLGAAFYGANSSKKFKVKGVNLYDGYSFEMRLVLKNSEEGIEEDDDNYYFKNVTLFKKKARFGATKEVTFKCKENIIAQIYKEDDNGVELVASNRIDSIKDVNQTGFKVSLTYEIHPIDVVKLVESKILYSKEITQSYTEKVRKTKPASEKKEEEDTEEEEQKVKEQETKEEEEKASDEEKDEESKDQQEKSENVTDSNATKSSKKKKKKEKIEYQTVEKFRNVTKKYERELTQSSTFNVFGDSDAKQVLKSKKLLQKYEDKQLAKQRLSEAKNKLEALIYEVKDRLDTEDFVVYMKESEKEKLSTLAQEKGVWYEDTFSNEVSEYKREYNELIDPLDKIKKRASEHRTRQDVKKRANEILDEYESLAKKIQKGKDWITDEQVDSLKANITIARDRVDNIHDKLQEVPLNEDSAFRNKDMIKEADLVKDQYFALKSKPKPKQDKKKKEEEKQKQKEESKQEDEVGSDEL